MPVRRFESAYGTNYVQEQKRRGEFEKKNRSVHNKHLSIKKNQ